MKDNKLKFSPITVLLHWTLGLSIIYLVIIGLYMTGLDNSPEKWAYYNQHKSIGVILLCFAAIRIYWRLLNKLPEPLSANPAWQEKMAKLVHILLLISTLMLPISGFIMSVAGGYPVAVFGLELVAESSDKVEWLGTIANTIHSYGSYMLIAMVSVHVLGAVKRSFIRKDGTFKRMLGKTIAG